MAAAHFTIGTPVGRWAGIGPYYAMFPLDFAFEVVQKFSAPEQAVLDPFAGRASSIYAAAATNRRSLGMEINPVGWLYGQAKLHTALKANVLRRLQFLAMASATLNSDALAVLPDFYHLCFAPEVLRFLLMARATLHWRTSKVDATLMAFILIYLHGKDREALSNQMRQGKSMSPDYSVRWWQERDLVPPDINVHEFLKQRIEWRYAKGRPTLASSSVRLGDSRVVARRIKQKVATGAERPFNLLFTSPPYYAITNYHYDQWLRLWMLGGPERPTRLEGDAQKKFESRPAYRALLEDVFGTCAGMMADDATVYVRTDARKFTYETTLDVLCQTFPNKTPTIIPRPFQRNTQTALFGDKALKPGEMDIILQ